MKKEWNKKRRNRVEMRKFQVGIVGLGARAETFARSLYAGTERGELAAFCDIDPDRTRKFCAYCEIENIPSYTDMGEFLAHPGLDAVIVTTPDFTHLDVAREVFAAGKHVYLEKPLDVTAARCREILRLQRESDAVGYLGFNLRASQARIKMKELIGQGVLGEILHIEGLEQLHQAHSASFMRRFHRHESKSGGLLNTKCSHDLDLMQWLIGHEHRVIRVASFGGTRIFLPQKAPATHCSKCPASIYRNCPYKAKAGFVFPVGGQNPIYKTMQTEVYGGDLCVYNDDKDLVDNQVVLLEWDHGVHGSFTLQLFQSRGRRETRIWGEKGMLALGVGNDKLRLTLSDTGDEIEFSFAARPGGHGGTDPQMLGRFFDAIEQGDSGDSGLEAGLAATLVAEKALEALKSREVVGIDPGEYTV